MQGELVQALSERAALQQRCANLEGELRAAGRHGGVQELCDDAAWAEAEMLLESKVAALETSLRAARQQARAAEDDGERMRTLVEAEKRRARELEARMAALEAESARQQAGAPGVSAVSEDLSVVMARCLFALAAPVVHESGSALHPIWPLREPLTGSIQRALRDHRRFPSPEIAHIASPRHVRLQAPRCTGSAPPDLSLDLSALDATLAPGDAHDSPRSAQTEVDTLRGEVAALRARLKDVAERAAVEIGRARAEAQEAVADRALAAAVFEARLAEAHAEAREADARVSCLHDP